MNSRLSRQFAAKLFSRFLRSVAWKVIAGSLLMVLVLVLLYLIVIAHYSLRFYERLGTQSQDPWWITLHEVHLWGSVSAVLLLMILAAGFMDLLSFFFIARRFRTITTVINRFAQGDVTQRAPVEQYRGYPDIARLARAFNHMADTLVNNIEELKRTDANRRELMANVAHDLGTPLTSIQGFVETIAIKDESLTTEERQKYINIIVANTRTLTKLVGELNDLSRLDAGEMTARPEPFSIVALTNDVASRLTTAAEKKRIAIELHHDESLPLAYADINMIERVLSNIVENAIRYSHQGGRVELWLKRGDRVVEVSCQDYGIGIPEADLPLVAERFYRVDKDRSRQSGGAGLGLAIAKSVLDLHGAPLRIESSPGQGTRVSFTLPVPLAPAPAAP